MLTLAKHMDVEARGYTQPGHPVQKVIGEALKAMTGLSPWPAPAIDGCGIPTFAIPLQNLAVAMARFARPSGLNPPRARACQCIANAMMQHPEMVAGEDRPCTRIMQALSGVVVKTGAEGVYATAWPERGLGLALKVEDGATRASSVALMALLDSLGAVNGSTRERLKDVARPTLKNHAGTVVGHIEPCSAWTGLSGDRGHASRPT
jgi:L-asparaginase II